ncbi:hypothetical protein PAMA_010215 [Pampus argenteus]
MKSFAGLNQDKVTAVAFDDPFGDDEDFTQDDLDEIDILASQAVASASGIGSKPGTKPLEQTRGGSALPSSAGQSKPLSRATTNQSRENTFGFISKRGNAGISSREPLGNRQQQFGSDRDDSYSLLEAQHADLKKKLKEVEEEIVLKSGEIRVLRDSLKAAQQEKEAQRLNQMLLETQRQKEQSDKEKELNKKVQSLQSELQFKEAEINEMKTKLHNSDKNKTASPLPRNSPKVVSGLAQLHHGSGGSNSSSPTGNGFITKETFGAQVLSRTTPRKTPGKTRRDDRVACSSRSGDAQEAVRPDPFLSVKPAHQQHGGGVLLGLLLQQPLSPSSLGLSHLLSMSLTDIHPTSSQIQRRRQWSYQSCSKSGPKSGCDRTQHAESEPTGICSQQQKQQLIQALDSLHSTSAGSSGSDSTGAGSLPAGCAAAAAGLGRLEEAGLTGFSVEDTGLAALRLLYLLLAHSDEVVEAVLSKESQSKVIDNKTDPSAAGVALHSQNALLRTVLRLCDVRFGSGGSQRGELVINALKILCVLVERTPHTHTDRLQCVLQVVSACVSADSKLQTVSECVSVLMSMSDHPTLAQQLCSHHGGSFVEQTDDSESRELDYQPAQQLSFVQTVVIVFHRQWLDLRDCQVLTDSTGLDTPPCSGSSLPWWRGASASLLRECLLLLHWLLLHHSSFSESCRPLLHMYDQVIPAVRDTLRKIPELSDSEELALEEICRSEGDDTDDMDTDTGS